jgi:hypothetical protein
MNCKHKKNPDRKVTVTQKVWRETTLRLIRAEQNLETVADAAKVSMEIARAAGVAQGRDDVLNLIKRWGKCRPLEGYNGEQMAEALRKVVTPTVPPYDDYKGITEKKGEQS